MKQFLLLPLLLFSGLAMGQVVIGPKGTRIQLDTIKWQVNGNNIFSKPIGNVGVGTQNPTAKFHVTGTVRMDGIGSNVAQSTLLTTDANGNLSKRDFSNLLTEALTTTSISNAGLANVPSQTIKGRVSVGTGTVEDLTAAQATTLFNTFSSTTKGLVPASGGGSTSFLRADGVFADPSSAGRQLAALTSDVINNNATANTLENVTGLSFSVQAGITYRFYATIPYTSSSQTNGSRWTINAPTTTFLSYNSRYTLSAITETINYLSTLNAPSTCNTNSNTGGNLAVIQGVIIPSANGTVQVRFASEISGQSITAKAGASLEWW